MITPQINNIDNSTSQESHVWDEDGYHECDWCKKEVFIHYLKSNDDCDLLCAECYSRWWSEL